MLFFFYYILLIVASMMMDVSQAYSATRGVPSFVTEKFAVNQQDDTMLHLYHSLASSGSQACQAIRQTIQLKEELEPCQLQAMETVWKLHCTQMTQHLDATVDVVFSTLDCLSNLEAIVDAQSTLRERMSEADVALQELLVCHTPKKETCDDTLGFQPTEVVAANIRNYQTALYELLDLQLVEIIQNGKSNTDRKIWDKMNRQLMNQSGDYCMGAFIHYMGGEQAFRTGWGKSQPGFLWNLVFSKKLQEYDTAFGTPLQVLETGLLQRSGVTEGEDVFLMNLDDEDTTSSSSSSSSSSSTDLLMEEDEDLMQQIEAEAFAGAPPKEEEEEQQQKGGGGKVRNFLKVFVESFA